MASTLAKIKDTIGEKIEEIKEIVRDERKVGDMEHRKHELAAKPELLATDRLLRLRVVSANFTKLDDYQHCFAVVTVGRNVARTAPRPLIDPKFADSLHTDSNNHTSSHHEYVRRQNLKKAPAEYVSNVALNQNDPENVHHIPPPPPATTASTLPGVASTQVDSSGNTITTHQPTAIEQATSTTTAPPGVAAAALAAPANSNPPPLHGEFAPVTAPQTHTQTQHSNVPMDMPKSGISEKEVNWEEHFSIEYTKGAEDEKIHVEVFAKTAGKDIFLGEYKMKIGDVVVPKKNADRDVETTNEKSHSSKDTSNWSLVTPQDYPLTDKNDSRVGTVCLLLRRETKLYGSLRVNIKEVFLEEVNQNVHQAKCIMKLVNEVQETSVTTGTHDRVTSFFKWNKTTPKTFDINTQNHVFDLFIELWNADPMQTTIGEVTPLHSTHDEKGNTEEINRGDKKVLVNPLLIGQARVTLYDARDRINEPIPMFTFDNRHVGYIDVDAELTEDTEKEHMAHREKKQARKILDSKKEHPDQADVELLEAKNKAVKGGVEV